MPSILRIEKYKQLRAATLALPQSAGASGVGGREFSGVGGRELPAAV